MAASFEEIRGVLLHESGKSCACSDAMSDNDDDRCLSCLANGAWNRIADKMRDEYNEFLAARRERNAD